MPKETLDCNLKHFISSLTSPEEANLIFDQLDLNQTARRKHEGKAQEISLSLLKPFVKAMKTVRFSLETNYFYFRYHSQVIESCHL